MERDGDFIPFPKQLNIFLKSSVLENRNARSNKKMTDICEMLIFFGWAWNRGSEAFYEGFLSMGIE